MRLPVLLSLVLALPWASATMTATTCEVDLDVLSALNPHFRVPRELATQMEDADARLLRAAARVLNELDDQYLERLAISLLEPSAGEADLSQNAFFIKYPELDQAYARAHYGVVVDVLADRLDEFELGLVAATLPKSPKLRPEWFTQMEHTRHAIEAEVGRRFRVLMASPRHREGLIPLLDSLRKNAFRLITLQQTDPLLVKKYFGGEITVAAVTSLIERVRAGRMSTREILATSFLLTGVYHLPETTPAEEERWVATGRARRVTCHGIPHLIYDADVEAEMIETSLIKEGVHHDVGSAMSVYRLIMQGQPLPLANTALRAGLVMNAERVIHPALQRLRATTPAAPAIASAPRSVPPGHFNPTDHFAPPPTSRRARSRAQKTAEPAAPVASPGPTIASARDLRAFTSYARAPRPLAELSADVTYEFTFIREGRRILRRARFAAPVLAWIKDNPGLGRQTLNALNLGIALGSMPGLKFMRPLGTRRFDGPIYEIKIHGKFRPVVVSKDGVYQVVSVSQKGDLARDVAFAAPLDEVMNEGDAR